MEFLIFVGLIILIVVSWKKRTDKNKSSQTKVNNPKENVAVGEYYETDQGNWRKKRAIQSEKPEYMKYIKARKLDTDFTVIDFETTGLNPTQNKIIQVAAVKYRDNRKIDEYTTNVNPQSKLSNRIKSITGLTDEDLVDAPLIEDVLPDLIEFISNETLVAHNASFDMKFLLHNINKYGFPYKKYRVLDTLGLSRKNIPTQNHKLTTLKSYLELDQYASHNALHDCYVTGEVYIHCHEKTARELSNT